MASHDEAVSDEHLVRDWFEDRAKQEHAVRFGMWLFLGSETLLFAGLFGLYATYRVAHTEAFLAASHHNNVAIGTINTVVLITSSFTVAWAIHALRENRPKAAVRSIGWTLLFATAFLVLKGIEYTQHFHEGILPGYHYRFAELPQPGARLFFTLYYFMTALHALHVIGGMVFLVVAGHMVRRGRITARRYLTLELAGLYWHLVDAIWIFLWPLLYIAG
jgi:cytochrome c oxidase subunit III